MMYVNAFWFGFLIGVITVVVLIAVIAFIGSRRMEDEAEEVSEEEFKEALEQLTGKDFRVTRDKHGNLVGEIINDKKEADDE